jgi:Holliday junction DNA helicase RuvA
MIASLNGELLHKSPEKVIIDVNGVGYEVSLSTASMGKMPPVNDKVFLHIHTNVREDALTLFGFLDIEEKKMFLLLIGVSGIGPKLAMTILSGIRPAELSRAVATRDIGRLTGVSGVGKKTAERLCLDLQDKIGFLLEGEDHDSMEISTGGGERGLSTDVISVLMNLGYPQVRASQALNMVRKRIPVEQFAAMKVEDLLRETLRSLA